MADFAGITGGSFAAIWNTVKSVGTVVFYGGVGMGILYIFIYFMRYSVPIYIFKQEGKSTRIFKDRGERNRKKLTFKALKNKDIKFPYPETKYEMSQGKKGVLCAYVRNQSATWLEISPNPHFVPADFNMQAQMINDFESTWNFVKPAEGFWDKYGQQIIWIGSIGIFLVVIILILKRMDRIMDMSQQIASLAMQSGKQVI